MRTFAPTLALALALLAGCGKPTAPATAGGAPAPSTWLVAELPTGAVPVGELKKTAAEGDAVVVRGRIGGRRDPLSADSAVFVIMDSKIPSCADLHADRCPTPWDYCCETPESKVANTATVQVVDEAGSTLGIDLADHGLKPLDEIVVVGTVAPRADQAVLIIRATKVHKVS